MGFRLSWLAAKDLGKERLLDDLGLRNTGEADEVNETPLSAADLPTGWSVLWANDERFVDGDGVHRLVASGATVLAVHVNETCMHSTVEMFADGKRRWRLHHEGDERIDFLESEGALPPEAVAAEAELRALQDAEGGETAGVDYLFDVPLETARRLCGFKHDVMTFEDGEPGFTAVEPAPTADRSRGWIARLLRR